MTMQGFNFCPKNESDLKAMSKSVITRLARLHQGGFVHHDIQMPNILYAPNSDENFKYILINFKHGGYVGEYMSGKLLRGWDDGTHRCWEIYDTI